VAQAEQHAHAACDDDCNVHDHAHPHHHDDGINSFCITRDAPIPYARFQAWLDLVAGLRGDDLLRVKGLVGISEHPDRPIVIHGVQHVFHPPVVLDRWPSDDRRTRIVFITRNIEKATIEDTLRVFERRAKRLT
jgi:G3E family GTPase